MIRTLRSLFDLDSWQEILQTLLQNKSRSLLTAFGIFWGIFMLVFLMGGGEGLKHIMAKNFDGFAQNSCFIMTGTTGKPYKGYQSGREWHLNVNDMTLLRHRVPELETITPIYGRWGQTFTYADNTSSGTLKGIRPDYVNIESPHLSIGRFINETDIASRRKVCVIGKRVYEELFPEIANPCGQYICVDNVYYQVVGVSKMSSSIGVMGSAEQTVMIPASTMTHVYNIGKDVRSICLTARRGTTISEITPKIEQTLRQAHSLAPDDGQALVVFNMEAMFKMVDNLFVGIEWLTWLIGLGTLLSGVVGVSNIMMVTVRERTVEIGIRRAIGAKPSNILTQIMAESILLTLLAGMSGITLAVLLLQGVETLVAANGITTNFQIPFTLAIGAATTLALLGATAGIAPALRALAIKPIEAIRDE